MATLESRVRDGARGAPRVATGTEVAPIPGMLHLFHLGPLTLLGRPSWALAGVDEQGAFSEPTVEPDLPAALAALTGRLGAENLRCEPRLAELAGPAGIEVAPLPAEALVPRAVYAWAFVSAPEAVHSPSIIAAFLQACARFWAAAPWARFASRSAFRVELREGWREWTREAAVLGAEEEQRGLELYHRPGSVRRLVLALKAGRISAARKIDSTCVTFEAAPAWAIDAVQAAYALPVFPNVVRLRRGRPRAPERLELLQLASALETVAMLDGEERPPGMDAKVAICAGGYDLVAVSSAPDPVVEGPGEQHTPGSHAWPNKQASA
jgi:hypothetical protein